MTNFCRMVSSWPCGSGAGSGVSIMARWMERALEAKGWEVEFIKPPFSAGGYLATSAKRIFFNLRLRNDNRIASGAPVAAFDFDGFFFLRG